MMPAHQPLRLSQTLHDLQAALPWTPLRQLGLIRLHWPDIVGPQLARCTNPLFIRGHTLVVGVPSSLWAQELHFFRQAIVDRVAALTPLASVAEVRTLVQSQPPTQEAPSEMARTDPGAGAHASQPRRQLDERDLGVWLLRVQRHYSQAQASWLAGGYHPCRRCQAPTAPGYALCSTCEWVDRRPSKEQ
jgi:hypothetical protein